MNGDLTPAFWIIGFFAISFVSLYAISRLSGSSRFRRRRRRNYQRVAPRLNRPTVMLNVKSDSKRS